MTGEAKQEVERMLRAGERARAVQYLQDTFNIPSEDATILVETLEREQGLNAPEPSVPSGGTQLQGVLKAEVAEMLSQNRRMDAIKHVRENLSVSLNDAMTMVEEVASEGPGKIDISPAGCVSLVARKAGAFLMLIGALPIGAAIIIYVLQARSVSNSDQVTGVVVEMRSTDTTSGSAPVVEYTWSGSKRLYTSSIYSNPPAYEVGEQVPLFVNREDPEEVVVDSFLERWALIVGLAVPGAVLLLAGMIISYFARRKF